MLLGIRGNPVIYTRSWSAWVSVYGFGVDGD